MVKIILYGNQADARLTLPLCRVLSENGGVLYAGAGGIAEYSPVTPQFFVFETDALPFCSADKALILFKSEPSANQPFFSPSESVAAIAEGGNSTAFIHAKRLAIPMITYSMGAGNCLSVSSIDDCHAVISVNKSLTLLSGKILEPCEIAVRASRKLDSHSLLPVCAVMILCERFKGNLIEL